MPDDVPKALLAGPRRESPRWLPWMSLTSRIVSRVRAFLSGHRSALVRASPVKGSPHHTQEMAYAIPLFPILFEIQKPHPLLDAAPAGPAAAPWPFLRARPSASLRDVASPALSTQPTARSLWRHSLFVVACVAVRFSPAPYVPPLALQRPRHVLPCVPGPPCCGRAVSGRGELRV